MTRRPAGAHHDSTNVIVIVRFLGHEDAVVHRNGTFRKLACAMCVEGAVGHEHVEVHVECTCVVKSTSLSIHRTLTG